MILYYDNIIFTLQKIGGISVVWYELIKRLLKSNYTIHFLNYNNDNIFFQKLKFKRNHVKTNNLTRQFQRYINPELKQIKNPFIFHSSYYRTCNNPHAINITTVHDFTYEYFSHGLKKFLHSWQKRRAIMSSEYIICISEHTKKDLLKFIPKAAKKKIQVIYNGVSDDYKFLSCNENCKTNNIPYTKYIVFVGARDGYKNFNLATKAIAKSNYNLVIVGNPLNKKEKKELDSILNPKRYYCTGRVSNQELNIIYNNAFALLYPSSYEGFGIPVLEAQKAGCPVIAYNASSIPEIIGNTPLLLQELSAKEIIRCFNILENETLRNNIIMNGLENAKRFTWDKMYEQICDIYNEIIKNNIEDK